jgi:hypothetical protein
MSQVLFISTFRSFGYIKLNCKSNLRHKTPKKENRRNQI